MAEIINLNKARKARNRAAAKTDAATNRAAHGRTKVDKAAAEARKARLNRALDGARRERSDKNSEQ